MVHSMGTKKDPVINASTIANKGLNPSIERIYCNNEKKYYVI